MVQIRLIDAMNEDKIKSPSNPRLKHVRSVRDGREPDRIFIEGVRLAEEAMATGIAIELCVVEDNRMVSEREQRLLAQISRRQIETLTVDPRAFNSVTDTKSTQGIILIAGRPSNTKESFDSFLDVGGEASLPLILFLSQINNPNNLGAVIRAAEAAGVQAIIIGRNSADPYSSKALRSAMGSAFRIPFWLDADLGDVIDLAKQKGFRLVGATLNGKTTYAEYDWKQKTLLVLGSEAHGIDPSLSEMLETDICIPMASTVESLNLAVAAGIMFFESRRQNCQQ